MGKTAQAYLDGFGTVRSVLELDDLTVDEILGALDSEKDRDPSLTPWKRGFNAAIRSGLRALSGDQTAPRRNTRRHRVVKSW